MILTIGSLVQETSDRSRWLWSASLYTIACIGASAFLGAAMATIGATIHRSNGFALAAAWPGGILAVAYAMSDLGWVSLPRPRIRYAVPITWWRWWRPYRAAVMYGAALGVGVMTRVHFGAFYVLCAWCLLIGNIEYGAALMGTYGVARGLIIFPASWGANRHRGAIEAWLDGPLFSLRRAQTIVATVLMTFGTVILASSIATTLHLPL